MKRKLGLVLALLAVSSIALAQSAEDKEKALKYLESTRQGVEDATKGLSPAQLNFKAGPDRWSIAEVMEHIAAAEDMLRGLVAEQVMKAGPPDAGTDTQATDAGVMAGVVDRSHKLQAPEPLKPTNRFGSAEGSLKHFEESRAQTEEYLKAHNDLREHAMAGPTGAKLDGYEWVLLIAGHSERHTKQINEVKADPNFPKS